MGLPAPPRADGALARQADDAVLERYGPPGVVVNDRLEVVQFRGTDRSLPRAARRRAPEPAPQDGPGRPRRAAAHRAGGGAQVVRPRCRKENVQIEGNGQACDLVVLPVKANDGGDGAFVVLFEERTPERAGASGWSSSRGPHHPVPGGAAAHARGGPQHHEGVRRGPARGAGSHHRRARLGQRRAALGQRGAPEPERGAGDRQGGAPGDQRGAHHGERRAQRAEPGAPGSQRRHPEPPRRRRDPHPDARLRAPHPALHPPCIHRPGAHAGRRGAAGHRGGPAHAGARSRAVDRAVDEGVDPGGGGGPGPLRSLAPAAGEASSGSRRQDRRRHPLAGGHRRAPARGRGCPDGSRLRAQHRGGGPGPAPGPRRGAARPLGERGLPRRLPGKPRPDRGERLLRARRRAVEHDGGPPGRGRHPRRQGQLPGARAGVGGPRSRTPGHHGLRIHGAFPGG